MGSKLQSRTWRTAVGKENERLKRERMILLEALSDATGHSMVHLTQIYLGNQSESEYTPLGG